jgi:hypothetical protein
MSAHPDRFDLAENESDVIGALRECLRDWQPEELGQLPPKCRPGKIRDGEDIADLAYTLTTTRIEANESNELLVKLETIFARACRRLGQIESDTPRRTNNNDAQESR